MSPAATFQTVRINTGAVLFRVHSQSHQARWYGRRGATSRWDDPAGEFGVLYLGRSPIGAFAETLLRSPEDRNVVWNHVAQRRLATFRVVRSFEAAKLHGDGLAWFGVTAAEIAEPDYALTRKLSNRVHGFFPVAGIQYRSRFDNDALCLALFDRGDNNIEQVGESQPIDKAWARKALTSHGYILIEP